MIWQTILTDLKQRLLKIDTLHGLVFVPAGMLLLWAVYYALHHVITIAAAAGGIYLIIEGLRKILSNPVKAAIALDVAKAEHWAKSELGYDPTGVTAPPPQPKAVPTTGG